MLSGRRGVGLAVAAVVALVVAGVAVAAVSRSRSDRPIPPGPNVVVIMTDDQTQASLATMPLTQRLIGDQGATFTEALVSFPNCCPSRATYLTGQYAHNHGVRDNVGPHGGVGELDGSETLPVWLHERGYDAIHVGKYLNGWGADGEIDPPPGWDGWYSLIDPSTYRYYGYEVSVDGERRRHGDAPEDYSTDVLAAEVVSQIKAREGEARPFFLSFTPLAPHIASPERSTGATTTAGRGSSEFSKPVAPPRHERTFAGRVPPPSEAYDEPDVSDKPDDVRRPPISDVSRDYLLEYQVAELGALAAVDEAVRDIVEALEETGQLQDTVIVFTSDNGLYHGEHRLVSGKFFLYEPAVRVPLLVRGPGFRAGLRVSTPVVNIDLAPTIVDLTDARAGLRADGQSLLDLLEGPADTPDRIVLLENFRQGKANTVGVRTRRWTYFEHAGEQPELYDLRADPDQLENRAGADDLAEVEGDLAQLLDGLRDCAGRSCSPAVPASVEA